MGVLNVTPDSFSDGGRYRDPAEARDRAFRMAAEGADVIDIGGESSRPGAAGISAEEEISRVLPVIKALKDIKVPLSIDTYKSDVAERALDEGAAMINDITALGDGSMAGIIARHQAGIVLMHMKGEPAHMQDRPEYDDVMEEIKGYLASAVKVAESAGIDPKSIAVDPGIGFGKTLRHNLFILKHLDELKVLGKAILIGVSRKSFIGEITGKGEGERLPGTIAASLFAIMKGAGILRVHDVGAVRDAVTIIRAITES